MIANASYFIGNATITVVSIFDWIAAVEISTFIATRLLFSKIKNN
jgi:hypothetical protein